MIKTGWHRKVVRGAAWASLGIVLAAPLALGSVHRPVVIGVLFLVLTVFTCFIGGHLREKQAPRGARLVWPLVPLTLIPLLQSIWLPAAARKIIDPAGSRLLEGSPLGPSRFLPLSLDLPSTLEELGRAAAAMAVLFMAIH